MCSPILDYHLVLEIGSQSGIKCLQVCRLCEEAAYDVGAKGKRLSAAHAEYSWPHVVQDVAFDDLASAG